MLDQATAHVPVNLPVNAVGVPNGKVVRPPFQVPIQLSNQARDRLKALMTVRPLVQLLPLPLDRLFRRKHIQVLLVAPFQIAIIPKRVSHESSGSPLLPSSPPPASFPGLISRWNFPSSRDSMN